MTQTQPSRQASLLTWAAAGAGLFLVGARVYREFSKFNMKNKVVLITGGSRGLGLVLARQLAAKGARLALCARSADTLEEASRELSDIGDVMTYPVDVTNADDVKYMVNAVIEHYGSLDVIINNAGTIQVGPAEAMEIRDFEAAMNTNFWGPLYTIYAALPHFIARGGGKIVNISSIGGKVAMPHILPYTASKFALTGFSEGLHAELKKHNIQVTTVVPNLMRTGSPRNIDVKGDHQAEYAWFKLADSHPALSQDVALAAKQIIRSIEYSESEVTLTLPAKVATTLQALAPSWVSALMTLADKLLPENADNGHTVKKGYESESKLSKGVIASLTDKAALQNNEM